MQKQLWLIFPHEASGFYRAWIVTSEAFLMKPMFCSLAQENKDKYSNQPFWLPLIFITLFLHFHLFLPAISGFYLPLSSSAQLL